MASQIQLENFYQTVLTSPTIAATWDVSFTVATPPTYPKGWIVLSSENASKREVMYYHSVSGNTISVRWVNRVNPKEHTQNEIVRINDVAEVFNFITGQISTAFYIEKTGGLNITVWWGAVSYNGVTQSFNDTNLTLTNNATNYVKYDYPSNTISVDTVNSGNIKAIVVVASWVITSISYLTPKESFIDFTASLTGALPSQAWHVGEALVTDGTNVSWYGWFLQKVWQLRTWLSNWKIFTTNGSGEEWYVDVGANDTILTSNGTAAAPTFKSLPYASQAEAEAGTDNVKLMTPLRVAQYVPVASETVAGKVERATDAEAATWTDTIRYITPKQLADNARRTTKSYAMVASSNIIYSDTVWISNWVSDLTWTTRKTATIKFIGYATFTANQTSTGNSVQCRFVLVRDWGVKETTSWVVSINWTNTITYTPTFLLLPWDVIQLQWYWNNSWPNGTLSNFYVKWTMTETNHVV